MKIRSIWKKKLGTLVLVCVLTLSAVLASACGNQTEAADTAGTGETTAGTEADGSEAGTTADTENLAGESGSGDGTETDSDSRNGDQVDKAETVYGKADASGKVYEVSVEAVLKNSSSGDIEDYSTLYDLKNTEGDEAYTEQGNGVILWENHGEDIQYEGKSDDSLPVAVSISYYLDGKAISPEELAGKSGRVRIRFDYENLTAETIQVDGEAVTVPIPFVVMSALFLPEDTFENVTVTNGKTMSMSDQQIVMGYALPGVAEGLKLADYEPTEDMEIPDYVEITADVTNFELDFTATIMTNGVFNDMDLDDLDDADDLAEAMDDLAEASGELVDGTRELVDGAGTMGAYLSEYLTGVDALDQGAQALSEGLAAVNEQKGALADGAAALADGLKALDTSLSGLEIPEDSLDMAPASEAARALAQDASDLGEALAALQAALSQVESFAADAAAYEAAVETRMAAVRSALDAIDPDSAEAAAETTAREQAVQAADAAMEGTALSDEEKAAIREQVRDSIDVSGSADGIRTQLSEAREALTEMPSLAIPDLSLDMSAIGTAVNDMQRQLQILGGYTSALSGLADQLSGLGTALAQLKSGISRLSEGSSQLTAGIQALNEGMEQLYEGAKSLNEGSSQLVTAGDALSEGFDSLIEGTGTLSDGMKEFDREGIQELTKLAGDDLENVLTRFRALKEADSRHNNFSGLREGQTGSVRYIIETDAIEKNGN